jgi:plastocyanin
MRRSLAVVVVALGVVAAGCSKGSGPGPPPPSAGSAVTVKQLEFRFVPVDLVVKSSQGIRVENAGTVEHNFTILKTSIDVNVQPGQSTTLAAIGKTLKPGTYPFECQFHKAQGMLGVLTVVAG